ncbi:MAG: AMP-binding protein [Mycobacterium sp.]
MDVIGGIRQKLTQVVENGHAVTRLLARGFIDPLDLGATVQTAKLAATYGPQATMAIQGGKRFADLPAIVDERGTLTYKQVDDQSWALAHGLQRLGVQEGSVVGLLCRDHRGLVVAMAGCGKLGARLVLMNTGFAKPQFAEVCKREGVKVVMHDSEFLGLLDALPPELPRIITWVDEGAELPAGAQTLDDMVAANSTEPIPTPSKPGGSVILTSGTTGLPKGAPRDTVSPFASAQLADRVPFPRKGTMVIVSPIFHSTGWATYLAGAALGNKVVTGRQFNAENTLKMIAEHKADMLVAVDHAAPHDRTGAGHRDEGGHVAWRRSSGRQIALNPEAVQQDAGRLRRHALRATATPPVRHRHHHHRRAAGAELLGGLITCEVILYDNDQRIEETAMSRWIFVGAQRTVAEACTADERASRSSAAMSGEQQATSAAQTDCCSSTAGLSE